MESTISSDYLRCLNVEKDWVAFDALEHFSVYCLNEEFHGVTTEFYMSRISMGED